MNNHYKATVASILPFGVSVQTHSLLERHHCHAAKAILKESQLLDHLLPDERYVVVNFIGALGRQGSGYW